MKRRADWKLAPALIGLGSLLVYILACTSFSPDDSKVLYTTVDAKSGATAVAVYDRKSGKSELLFEPVVDRNLKKNDKPVLLRPQWLGDGHRFLVTWDSSEKPSDGSLSVAVLPFDGPGPRRMFTLPDLGDDGGMPVYFRPAPEAGKFLFFTGKSNIIIRLDYETGEQRETTNDQDIMLLPSPDNKRLLYLTDGKNDTEPAELGWMDPKTFARAPLFRLGMEKISLASLALSRDARVLAYQSEDESPLVIHLLETGKPARSLALTSLRGWVGGWEINVREFSPKGDVLYASFKQTDDTTTNCSCGFLEIPLDGSEIRTTVLISNIPPADKVELPAFQIDLSHDGRTLAVDSLWLVNDGPPLKAEDHALFLVDLSQPARKVTRVLIPPLGPAGKP